MTLINKVIIVFFTIIWGSLRNSGSLRYDNLKYLVFINLSHPNNHTDNITNTTNINNIASDADIKNITITHSDIKNTTSTRDNKNITNTHSDKVLKNQISDLYKYISEVLNNRNITYGSLTTNCLKVFPSLIPIFKKIAFMYHFETLSNNIYKEVLSRNILSPNTKIIPSNLTSLTLILNDEINSTVDIFNITTGISNLNMFPYSRTYNLANALASFSKDSSSLILEVESLKDLVPKIFFGNHTNVILHPFNCLCNIISDTQSGLNLPQVPLNKCLEVIESINNLRESSNSTFFDLTPASLGTFKSKLSIPDEYVSESKSLEWRNSKVIGQTSNINSTDLPIPLDGTIQKKKILYTTVRLGRELLMEHISATSLHKEQTYYDSRDIATGYSCVYTPYNQGECGGCYAFVAVSTINTATCVQTGLLIASLSPQQIIDCSGQYGNEGCDGGFYANSWSYALSSNSSPNSICSWDNYPYDDNVGTCTASQCTGCETVGSYEIFSSYSINGTDGWDFVTSMLPRYGVIAVSVNSQLPGFHEYSGGIYKAPKCSSREELDHAVLLIGYGISDQGEKYYVMQNSWGITWGIEGFMNVSADSCDMFWLPGIINQFPSDSINTCPGNPSLLIGPNYAAPVIINTSNAISQKPRISILTIILASISYWILH
ncbi:papain family cysteine protease, putative [Cryptosporidium muris RN66]|uniref:Papain family cysteine protease, putative n=1 Tax=Cryptosporidium muris (strain RN66) TaxID=441375 RepID=B6ABS5_CRYMR|nr:papain family cysteine protease, putative [Cryptosporidium muris RN66]EEA05278.1 papain family cysteine protease, putative [Cryptosporidium muris RN66]|eukprot:XP_002139627.1 papain family cysteine protease [Cryptosporidium muris RN66]